MYIFALSIFIMFTLNNITMIFLLNNWMYIAGIIAITVLFAVGMKHTLTLLNMQKRELEQTQYKMKKGLVK